LLLITKQFSLLITVWIDPKSAPAASAVALRRRSDSAAIMILVVAARRWLTY
jgi:hypothetical protein